MASVRQRRRTKMNPAMRILVGVALVGMLGFVGCGTKVDEKISQVKKGMTVREVINLVGKPEEVWGSPLDDKMALIYHGNKSYSVLLYGSMVLDVQEGELGGPNALPLNQRIDIVINGGSIEFRRQSR
jgi:hypothetical protein